MVVLSVHSVPFCSWKFIVAMTLGGLGGFQHGYHMAVFNTPGNVTLQWLYYYNLTDKEYDFMKRNASVNEWEDYDDLLGGYYSLIVCMFFVGGVIGAAFSGLLAIHVGRRNTLISSNVLVALGCGFMGIGTTLYVWTLLLLGRFLIGVHAGINSIVAPMYLVEIAAPLLRGLSGASYYLMFSIGILAAVVAGLPSLLGDIHNWYWLFLISMFPAIIQMCMLPMVPESPCYLLLTHEDDSKAEESLFFLRNRVYIEPDVVDLDEEVDKLMQKPIVTVFSIFMEYYYKVPVLLSIGVLIGQQFTGVVIFFSFSTMLFDGYFNDVNTPYVTLTMMLLNLIGASLGLFFVETFGRRLLFICGYTGIIICVIFFAFAINHNPPIQFQSQVSIFFIDILVFMFGLTVGPCSWFYIHELMSHFLRPIGGAITASYSWLSILIMVYLIFQFADEMKMFLFWILVLINLLSVIFSYLYLPETMYRTSAELIQLFEKS